MKPGIILAAILWMTALYGIAIAETLVARDDPRLPIGKLHEEVLTLPGDPARPVMLQVTFYKPPGSGPFPLAVINHGATDASSSNRGERYRFSIPAWYFLSRGYAVALPMMRGFAGSGGAIVDWGCDLAQSARDNAADISAVIQAITRRSDIDRSRIVAAGQSFGGWNILALGVTSGASGLIAFNPAFRASDCAAQDSSMEQAAAEMGTAATIKSLWFYGDNDKVMPSATWRAVFARYRQAGGDAELAAIGSYRSDSHQFLGFPDSLPLWSPKVDAFLNRLGMPSRVIFADYLPSRAPPPTNFASLTDVAAVPLLNQNGRPLYRRFLETSGERAFVLAPNGSAAEAHGGYDPLGHAIRLCARSARSCRAYAVNDDVVWSPAPAHPAAWATRPGR